MARRPPRICNNENRAEKIARKHKKTCPFKMQFQFQLKFDPRFFVVLWCYNARLFNNGFAFEWKWVIFSSLIDLGNLFEFNRLSKKFRSAAQAFLAKSILTIKWTQSPNKLVIEQPKVCNLSRIAEYVSLRMVLWWWLPKRAAIKYAFLKSAFIHLKFEYFTAETIGLQL